MRPYPSRHGRRDAVTATAKRDFTMTTSAIITVVDRFALTLMNGIALIGVPLIAFGVLTQTL